MSSSFFYFHSLTEQNEREREEKKKEKKIGKITTKASFTVLRQYFIPVVNPRDILDPIRI
jgi:hypothetical protein